MTYSTVHIIAFNCIVLCCFFMNKVNYIILFLILCNLAYVYEALEGGGGGGTIARGC